MRFHQCATNFLPATLSGKGLQFARLCQLTHQTKRFRGDLETQIGEARGKARHAQHAQRVFGESWRDVAQQAPVQILLAAVRVNDAAIRRLRHRVDGQVAPNQVVLQGHIRAGVESKATVAFSTLALSPGKGIFLACLRLDKYREVLPDGLVTLCEHGFGGAADHHPVTVGNRAVQELIADGAADQIDGRCG